MHAAASLLPWLPLVVLFGGWETGPHFDDLWIGSLSHAMPGAEAAGSDEDEQDLEEAEVDDDDEDVIAIRVMDEDGSSRIVQLPRHVLARLMRDGVLQGDDADDDAADEDDFA